MSGVIAAHSVYGAPRGGGRGTQIDAMQRCAIRAPSWPEKELAEIHGAPVDISTD